MGYLTPLMFFMVKKMGNYSAHEKNVSGGPAGGQTFEKFDKQVFIIGPK